jgi:hypothetical protein
MIEEYIYKAAIDRAEIIDKTLWSILKARRPKTFAVLNAVRWPLLWRAFGIRLVVRYKGPLFEEYEVFQFETLLATFEVRTNIQAA